MSLLSRHVSELKSEEFVLGVSTGFKGEAGSRFEGLESTKLVIVAAPSSKNWTGFTAVEQSIGDASGWVVAMIGKQFPARCLVTYRRQTAVEKRSWRVARFPRRGKSSSSSESSICRRLIWSM